MIEEPSFDRVASLLSAALELQGLSAKAKRVGNRLLDRLSSPVQITLMGPSVYGKRAIINALAERTIVPHNQKLPTYEVCFGDTPLLRVTGRDGAKNDLRGHDFPTLTGMKPSFLQIFANDPFFRTVSLLDIVTDGSPDQQLAAAKWASQMTDIAIWVTHDFAPDQQKLWSRMPDAMHNHCFLVLATGRIGHSDLRASGYTLFRGVYPVAIDADAGVVNAEDIKGLRAELKRCVDTGLQADVDQALVFLNKFASELVPGIGQEVAGDTSDSGDNDTATTETLSLNSFASDACEPAHDDIRNQQRAALALIESNAKAMLDSLGSEDRTASPGITGQCAQTAEELCDLTTAENPLHDAALRAADYLVLLDLENEDDSPDNAVTALLQMKRVIEIELAA